MDYKYESKGFGKTRRMTQKERLQFMQRSLIEHEQGLSFNMLADKYGVRRDTIKYMIRKAKQYKENPTSIPIPKQEFSNILHIHRSTLWRWKKKYGKPTVIVDILTQI